jgi:hypothetical protein
VRTIARDEEQRGRVVSERRSAKVTGLAALVSGGEQGKGADRPFFAEGVGMLIALMDQGALNRRGVVYRLQRLQDTDEFASLPEDLRERIREIIDDDEP